LALAIDQCPQALQDKRAGALAGQPHQHEFGQSPGMQRLPGLLGIQLRDTRSMVGPKDNDLLVGQLRQHATDGAASNTKHLRQAFFGKATGRVEALFENGIEHP
jgi:hypothetical protein